MPGETVTRPGECKSGEDGVGDDNDDDDDFAGAEVDDVNDDDDDDDDDFFVDLIEFVLFSFAD